MLKLRKCFLLAVVLGFSGAAFAVPSDNDIMSAEAAEDRGRAARRTATAPDRRNQEIEMLQAALRKAQAESEMCRTGAQVAKVPVPPK